MKKISLYLFSILMLASLSACNEDFKDWADAQSNKQEDSLTVKVPLTALISKIEMDTCKSDSIGIAQLGAIANAKDVSNAKLVLGANNTTVTVPCVADSGIIKVNASELELATAKLYNSRQSVFRTITASISVSALAASGEALIIKGEDLTMALKPVTTPALEDGYYALGDISSWDANGAMAFTQDASDKAIFTLVFDNEKNKPNFKIFPKSGISNGSVSWDKALGAIKDADLSLSGLLDFTDKNNVQAGAIGLNLKGKVKITINVRDFTYTIAPAVVVPTSMYMIGSIEGASNWSKWLTMTPVTETSGKFWRIQFFKAGDQMKFNLANSWEGHEQGYSDGLVPAESKTLAGVTASGDGNIVVGNAGWYTVVVTATIKDGALAYTLEFFPVQVAVIGTCAGLGDNNWSESSVLASNSCRFAEPDGAGAFVLNSVPATGDLRVFAKIPNLDWWRSEFVPFNGKIEYRENRGELGNLNIKTNATAGQKVSLDFINGTGSVE